MESVITDRCTPDCLYVLLQRNQRFWLDYLQVFRSFHTAMPAVPKRIWTVLGCVCVFVCRWGGSLKKVAQIHVCCACGNVDYREHELNKDIHRLS